MVYTCTVVALTDILRLRKGTLRVPLALHAQLNSLSETAHLSYDERAGDARPVMETRPFADTAPKGSSRLADQ